MLLKRTSDVFLVKSTKIHSYTGETTSRMDLRCVTAASGDGDEPLRRAMGKRFGWLRSYSALPFSAWLVAVLLLLHDVRLSVVSHL
jgi:hypothetical protein